jgi:diguanylate cyclase (GGDEF)-like protein
MSKLTLHEFYQLEPKTGAFRLQVLEAYRKIFRGDELDFIPWARIFDDLRKEPGFSVQSKEKWEEIRRNATVKKLQNNQGAAKRHFMSLWFWLYKDHADPVANKILNEAAQDLFEAILGFDEGQLDLDVLRNGGSQIGSASEQAKSPSKSLQEPDEARAQRRKNGKRFLEQGVTDKHREGPEFEAPFVTILDVDDLTVINDKHGWEVGSEILRVFEKAIEDACSAHLFSKEYVCGICGDDTFFFVIYSRNVSSMTMVFNEFSQLVVDYNWEALSPDLRVTFSAGWSQRENLETSLSCSQRAEEGMKKAKELKGRNTLETGPPMKNFSPKHEFFGWS